jgi:hypothetical protein
VNKTNLKKGGQIDGKLRLSIHPCSLLLFADKLEIKKTAVRIRLQQPDEHFLTDPETLLSQHNPAFSWWSEKPYIGAFP